MTIEDILEALKGILDAAEGRDLTDEEVERYEKLELELAAKRKTVEIRSRQKAYETPVRDPGVLAVATTTADDTLERAFSHYLRTGQQNADLVQLRAQSEGAPTEGGYLVPDSFRNKLVERMKAFGGIANHAETLNTSDGRPMPWPTIDDTANVGEIVQEGGTFSTGADLVFGEASLGAYRYMAGGGSALPLRVSVELLQDAAFDVEALVSRKLGERIARIQATHLISGNGASQPLGITYGLVGTEVSSALSYDDLVDAIHRVDPAYRESGCKWAFNDLALAAVKKIKDSHGDPIWRPMNADMATDTGGGTLLGYPVVIDQGFSNLTLTSGALINWGVFGNIAEGYVVRRVKDFTLVVNPWTRAANGQVEYTAWARMDATRQNTNAYTVLAGYTA